MNVDLKQIKKLLKIMDDNKLTEISVKHGEDSICLKKQGDPIMGMVPSMAMPTALPAAPAAANAAAPAEAEAIAGVEICSPMVGTFYRSPAPESAPFVNVGDSVSVGQTLCILEAMKLMNEYKSEISGKILKILVESGQPVEFGQPLFIVEK